MAAVISVAATAAADRNVQFFKCLVKEKRIDCFGHLGGSVGIAAKLASHAEHGIRGDGAYVRRRKEVFGENTYPKPKPKSFLGHVWVALSDVFLVALLVCAAFSLGFSIKEHGLKEGWYEGVSIFLADLLVLGVTAVISHREAKQGDNLARQAANIAVTVVRADRRQEVSISDLVVGDVVILKIGDAVPADGVFLEGNGLQVDESSFTGEPHPVEVDAEKNPFLMYGVKVVDGHGSMLVTAVGTDTAWGELMRSSFTLNKDPTTLQGRLDGLTSAIGKIGIAVTLVVFTVLTARHFTGSMEKPPLLDKDIPLAVTLMLTFSMKRLVKDNVLVNRLSALETMGSATVICADKTRTLTLNQMKVIEFWVGTDQPRAATAMAASVISLLCQGAGLNTTGRLYWPDNVSPPEICGSPTEKALLSWAVEYFGMDAESLKRRCKVIRVEAFNTHKKCSGVITRDSTTGAVVAHRKGDAEMVLANCSMYVGVDGATSELGFDQRNQLEKVISDMEVGGLKCVAFAFKQVDGDLSKVDDEGLTLLGLVGLKDPCRPDVKAAVEDCRKAGIAVKMLTGDNILTARAIAMECGILSSSNDPDGVAIEGHEFQAMSIVRQLEMVENIRVMARSQPLDKLVLIQRLKQKGHVVAVTSDGPNDAPALKEADIGLSMGIQGTDVAKDFIILNDRFETVVRATWWGRSVYTNIQKFIQFQLTVNVTALCVNVVSAITIGNTPLTTVQLVWVNVAMGTASALALAVDSPTVALMNRPPIPRTAPLISNAMWRNLIAQAAFQITVLLALQYIGNANDTMIFNAFVLCQVFNEFNIREIEKKNVLEGVLEKNRMFLLIVAVTVVLQVVTVEVLTRIAGTKRLGLGQWGVCLAIAAVSWPIGWTVKFIPVPVGCTWR